MISCLNAEADSKGLIELAVGAQVKTRWWYLCVYSIDRKTHESRFMIDNSVYAPKTPLGDYTIKGGFSTHCDRRWASILTR